MNPTISVIIPCYNQGEFLSEAINSVIGQTYLNWEAIIINDGSSDNTEELALSYVQEDARIKYIKQPNKGISSARNTGIASAKGDFILPLDADDKIAPDYILKGIGAFERDDSLKLVYGNAEFFGNRNGPFASEPYDYFMLLLSNLIYCSAIFKKEDFSMSGGYSEEMAYGFEDWDLWIRLLRNNGKVFKLKETVFFYRIKEVSRSTNLAQGNREILTRKLIIKRNSEIYNEYLPELVLELRKEYIKNMELEGVKTSRTYAWLQKINKLKRKFSF